MATFTNQTKSIASTFTQESKDETTFVISNQVKGGAAWPMGHQYITMGGTTDPISGLPVYMGSLGTAVAWTNQSEN